MIQEDWPKKRPSKEDKVKELFSSHTGLTGLYDFLKLRAEEEKMSVEDLVVRLIKTYKEWAEEDAAEREQQELKGEIVPIPEGVAPEALKQRVRDFLEALVDKDFERAYTIARSRFSRLWCDERDDRRYVVRVITIGEPFRRNDRYANGKGVHIPFEIELANGKMLRQFINIRWDRGYVKMRSKELGIDLPEEEWVFDGGFSA